MKFTLFANWDDLPKSADALFSLAEKETLLYSRAWFENLSVTGLDHAQRILLPTVTDEAGRVQAILPLLQKQGCDEALALSNHFTTHYTVLLGDSDQPSALACLAQGLAQHPFESLTFKPIDAQDEAILRFQDALESAGYQCHSHFRHDNWIHHTNGQTFDTYMAGRPAKLRNTIVRKRRKLDRERRHHIEIFTHDHFDRAITDYTAIFSASWKGREPYGDFIPGLIRASAARGWLRLGILYIDERPAAAQIWLTAHNKAHIFRLAYDEVWKAYSPGSILTAHMMEHAITHDRAEYIDFLTGNDAYKQDWMSARRERWALGCILKRNQKPNRLSAKGLFNRLRQK